MPSALAGGGTLPPFREPQILTEYVQAGANSKLFVCGKNGYTFNFECYSLTRGATTWNLVVFNTPATTSNIPNRFVGFTYNKQLWIIGDDYPKVFDLFTNAAVVGQDFWDTSLNPPTMAVNKSKGGGCPVVIGDYVYLFGGVDTLAIRRMYLKGLGVVATPPVLPAQDGTRTWEYIGQLPGRVYPGGCATNPLNRNQVVLEVDPGIVYIYDINQITTTNPLQVATTFDFGSGTPLTEICHDNRLYAFPNPTGAKYYSPTLTGGTNWPDVTAAGTLAAPRYNPPVVVVPKEFLPAGCAGC